MIDSANRERFAVTEIWDVPESVQDETDLTPVAISLGDQLISTGFDERNRGPIEQALLNVYSDMDGDELRHLPSQTFETIMAIKRRGTAAAQKTRIEYVNSFHGATRRFGPVKSMSLIVMAAAAVIAIEKPAVRMVENTLSNVTTEFVNQLPVPNRDRDSNLVK